MIELEQDSGYFCTACYLPILENDLAYSNECYFHSECLKV